MFYQYGLYKPLVAKKLGRVMTLRQLAPAAFVVGLLVALVLAVWWPAGRLLLGILLSTYPLAALGCCAGLLRRDPKAGLASALAFPVLHLSYGLGFLAGMLTHRELPAFPASRSRTHPPSETARPRAPAPAEPSQLERSHQLSG